MVTTDIGNIHQFTDKMFKKEDLEEIFLKICSTHSVNLTLDQVMGS